MKHTEAIKKLKKANGLMREFGRIDAFIKACKRANEKEENSDFKVEPELIKNAEKQREKILSIFDTLLK